MADVIDGAFDAAATRDPNGKMLRYDEALRPGLPIATGVIEGACRRTTG